MQNLKCKLSSWITLNMQKLHADASVPPLTYVPSPPKTLNTYTLSYFTPRV